MNLQPLLTAHVAIAALALAIGLAAMLAGKRRGAHTRIGLVYFWAVTALNLTGGALAILDWERNGPFLAIAISTQAFAILGLVAAGRSGRKWLIAHAIGMTGSYTQLVGAFVVNNWFTLTGQYGKYSPMAFLLPGGVGTLVMIWLGVQIYRGRRPKALRSSV